MGMENLHYEERLERLGLMRLGRRRAKSDLLEAFKIINGQYDITLDTLLHLMMLEEEDIAKVIQEKKLIGYKEICICLTELWTTGMFCLTVAWNALH